MKLSSFALWAVGTLASLAILETVSAAPMDPIHTGETASLLEGQRRDINSVPRWKEPGSGALGHITRAGHGIRQAGEGKVSDSRVATNMAKAATKVWDFGASGARGAWNGGARVARGAGSAATWPFRKFRNTFGTKGWYNTMATPGRVIGEKVKPLYKNPTVDRVRGWGTAARNWGTATRKTVFGTKAEPNPYWKAQSTAAPTTVTTAAAQDAPFHQ